MSQEGSYIQRLCMQDSKLGVCQQLKLGRTERHALEEEIMTINQMKVGVESLLTHCHSKLKKLTWRKFLFALCSIWCHPSCNGILHKSQVSWNRGRGCGSAKGVHNKGLLSFYGPESLVKYAKVRILSRKIQGQNEEKNL